MYYCTTIICHDVLMIFINLNDVAVLSKKVADYHCIVNDLAKSDTYDKILTWPRTEEHYKNKKN